MAVVQEAYVQAVSTRRVDDLVKALGMSGICTSQVSLRLDLAMTLIGKPRIIVLDEPTTGLDPRSDLDAAASAFETVARNDEELTLRQLSAVAGVRRE